MFSRNATGVTEGPTSALGAYDFAAVTGLDLGSFAAESGGTAEGAFVANPAPGFLAGTVGPATLLGATAALAAGFVAELPAALSGEFGAEADAGADEGDAGLAAELVDGDGFGAGGFGDGAPAELALAPAADWVGGCNALRMVSGFAGACCAITGIASDDNKNATSKVFSFAFGMVSSRSRISALPFISQPLRLDGRLF